MSKAYGIIRRFSEDVDITYDIRAFAPDLVGGADSEALPPTRSQARRWTKAIRSRLDAWVCDEAAPSVTAKLRCAGFEPRIKVEGDRLYVFYDPLFGNYGLMRSEVIVEFGARSTGEPRLPRSVECDAASFLPDLLLPRARPSVMLAERTFWEKATAIHIFCRQERLRSDRLSRHWHDLVRLDDAGVAASAVEDRALAHSVARHKAILIREKDIAGNEIDYHAAVGGGLQLIPSGAMLEALGKDYATMRRDGMLRGDDEPFERLVERCAKIETRANAWKDANHGP